MRVIRAEAMGMCFGVRDAVRVAMALPGPRDVTILGELVHNEQVLRDLTNRGFIVNREHERDRIPSTSRVLVTAHGISERRRRQLVAAGKQLIDTTCPLVRRVHQAARELKERGYFVLVIGRRGHVEVQGIVEDLDRYEVVEQPDDVRRYAADRLGIICQTTTPPRAALRIRKEIHALNPGKEIRNVSTICRPTRDRQYAMLQLLEKVEAVVVVGGRNSNNTRQLAGLAELYGKPCLHVQSPDDLQPHWFALFEVVGLTAGTSTPDEVIEAVYQKLLTLGASRGLLEMQPVRVRK